ncbi:hypothetical protein Acsp04_31690 [Actinomadura sp. NBRC 104425]|uniref:hypothetical protein n=1 Tax=Actinomadura sp. NBRC 104425 TaxID=3032204 RepID=UPI0024A301D2|nr:hypothetical protein [Actinomadura sp. NBRC 104425]GLZ12934.1 hypothetical protein Acsp04_31690 [Actinomadura sp. NBRC 104425]
MAEIRVGKPHVKPDTPSHTKGVHQGNKKGAFKRQMGHHMDGTADARRSTGVNPRKHEPILPVMPNLPPG